MGIILGYIYISAPDLKPNCTCMFVISSGLQLVRSSFFYKVLTKLPK